MTDGRVSGVQTETSETPTTIDARVSREHTESALTPSATAQISREHTETSINPATDCRVSAVEISVSITVIQPYLQDMYGHFVHSMHTGSKIKPIRSLKKTTYP